MTGVYEVRRYSGEMAADWDAFVEVSKNATFLHARGFMDYHADRFQDHSLVIYLDGRLVALLPANASGDDLQSHGGLTYGGVLTAPKMSVTAMPGLFDEIVSYARGAGFKTLYYKAIPHIYHAQPAEEDLSALFRLGADLVRVDTSSTVPITRRRPFSGGKKDGLRKARKAGLDVRESTDWPQCWAMLTAVLSQRHGAQPVHSLAEITLLASRFPERIRLFGAFDNDAMVSALVMFDCARTVHVQYIASAPQGQTSGGVDVIVKHLLDDVYADRDWFDFGISTTDGGRTLNEGLARQKEMFGAGTTTYQHFRLSL